MNNLKKIVFVKNMPKYNKFRIELECGHKFVFDHSLTNIREVPLILPCKICFGSHK